MRALLQRVSAGRVTVEGQIMGEIGAGYVILLGVTHADTTREVNKLAEKTIHLRVFSDDADKMNRSALDVGAEILVISQFTLYADARKGRRPSYTDAAPPEIAAPLVDAFAAQLRTAGIKKVATGVFGATMLVEIDNDGPVTIMLDTEII
jgi:D-tyrosyl-tRNA(Tyr) deacylase